MENINVSFPNDGLGDKVRNAFIKVNSNFSELDLGKVNKITGKGLSTNDYTNIDKALVTGSAQSSTILNINGNSYNLSSSREWRVAQADTGVELFSGLTYTSSNAINIGAARGYVVNNETNPLIPTYTEIIYPGENNKTVTTLGSGIGSIVMLGPDGFGGGTISFQNTFPTSAERKTKIFLGKVGHPTGTITTVINEPDIILSPLAFARDLFQAFNYINDGVYPYANGANLNVNITGGNIHGNGINFVNNKNIPNELVMGPYTPMSFLYRSQTGAGGTSVTNIDPTSYDNAGTITAVGGGSNNSTLQWIFAVPGSGFIIQYGQTIYSSLLDAIEAIGKEEFVVYPSLINNAILIGVLAVNRTATALNNISKARFFKADKLGQIIGAQAGITTGTIQTAYNNSVTPQMTVTDTLGAFAVKSGRAFNTGSIQEWQNTSGSVVANINGNGVISGSAFYKTGGLSTEYLKADGSISTLTNPIVSVIKDSTASSPVTGVVVETLLKSYLIPSGTFASDDVMNLNSFKIEKTGVAGAAPIKVYFNTSNSLSGATQLALFNVTTTQLFVKMNRSFTITGGTIKGCSFTTTLITDVVGNAVAPSSNTFNPAINNYILTTVTPANAGDSIIQREFIITN